MAYPSCVALQRCTKRSFVIGTILASAPEAMAAGTRMAKANCALSSQ